MQSYKDPFSSRNDNTNWRGWTEPGRWGAQGGYNTTSMLDLDQFPGQSAAERVAPRNAFNQLNPLSGSGPFQSTYTPGVGYKSFEEALAVGKEARTKKDMEDYERYAAALGLPITPEGFAQYSKEKGAERGLEMSTAQKNAEIARDQANKNRQYMFEVLQADRAAGLKMRDQQISAQREMGRQGRWERGGSTGSGGTGGSRGRAYRQTTQAVTAAGSGAFNNATERQVADYLIKAGVNEHQLNTGLANWKNKRQGFERGEEEYETGFPSPTLMNRELGDKQAKNIRAVIGRGDLTGLGDLPVDHIDPGVQVELKALLRDRRNSTVENRASSDAVKLQWDTMRSDFLDELNRRNSLLKKPLLTMEDLDSKVSETQKKEMRSFITNNKSYIEGEWRSPHWKEFNDKIGDDFDSVNPFSKILEPGDEPIILPSADSPRPEWEDTLNELRAYEEKYGQPAYGTPAWDEYAKGGYKGPRPKEIQTNFGAIDPFSFDANDAPPTPEYLGWGEDWKKSGIPREYWPDSAEQAEAARGRDYLLRQKASRAGLEYDSPEFQAMVREEEEKAAHDQFMADYSRELRATKGERELARPPQPQGPDTDDPLKLAQYEAILAPPMERDPIEEELERRALERSMQEDIHLGGGGELLEYQSFDPYREWEDRKINYREPSIYEEGVRPEPQTKEEADYLLREAIRERGPQDISLAIEELWGGPIEGMEDERIPWKVGRNVPFADPEGASPDWGSQVVGPHLENPNWELFKTNLGNIPAAVNPMGGDIVRGLAYGVNKFVANPLLSFAEAATGEPYTDYNFPTEDIFQDRAAPILNPLAYTEDAPVEDPRRIALSGRDPYQAVNPEIKEEKDELRRLVEERDSAKRSWDSGPGIITGKHRDRYYKLMGEVEEKEKKIQEMNLETDRSMREQYGDKWNAFVQERGPLSGETAPRKPRVRAEYFMETLLPRAEANVRARLSAEGKRDDPVETTNEALAWLRERFHVVDEERLSQMLGI
jgi:hypothetical protein